MSEIAKVDKNGGVPKTSKSPKSDIFGVSLVPVHTPPKLSQGRCFYFPRKLEIIESGWYPKIDIFWGSKISTNFRQNQKRDQK